MNSEGVHLYIFHCLIPLVPWLLEIMIRQSDREVRKENAYVILGIFMEGGDIDSKLHRYPKF